MVWLIALYLARPLLPHCALSRQTSLPLPLLSSVSISLSLCRIASLTPPCRLGSCQDARRKRAHGRVPICFGGRVVADDAYTCMVFLHVLHVLRAYAGGCVGADDGVGALDLIRCGHTPPACSYLEQGSPPPPTNPKPLLLSGPRFQPPRNSQTPHARVARGRHGRVVGG